MDRLMRWVIPDSDAGGYGPFWTRQDSIAVDVDQLRAMRDGAFLILAEMERAVQTWKGRGTMPGPRPR